MSDETRMFTDPEESQIFSIAGEMIAAVARLRSEYIVDHALMTLTFPRESFAALVLQVEDLELICATALAREHLPIADSR